MNAEKGEPRIQQNEIEQKAGETKESDNLPSSSPKITEQEIIKLQQEDEEKLSQARRELGIIEDEKTDPGFAEILNKEQKEFLTQDSNLSNLSLSDQGTLEGLDNIEDSTEAQVWRQKEGVLDAKVIEGALVIIYNANEKLPEGCPDFSERSHGGMPRSAEYHPDTKLCFIDLTDSWSFLEDRYKPPLLQQFVRHELRHHLVALEDERISTKEGSQERRNVNWEDILAQDPGKARELAYLDELHSQYFDAIDGARDGRKCFRTIDSEFYSVAGEASHRELGAETKEGQQAVEELFYLLQGFLLLKMMSEQQAESAERVSAAVNTFGVLLGTERSIESALQKGKEIWRTINSDEQLMTSLHNFLSNYEPNPAYNTPVSSDALQNLLGETREDVEITTDKS